jgi:hypothetical protein
MIDPPFHGLHDRPAASRSSNLALPREFNDEAKHEFAEQTSAYVKEYFRSSLEELSRRNPANESSSDNSYNEILEIQIDKQRLQWRAQMGAFSGRDTAKGLSQEGAAEHLWSMLISSLQ